ncbi:pre-mRNA processing RNA-helicase [Vermiconidia calcicola]|uniref:Pre-mRNA processing RNA-helicase n=1 Tax=Vermiconidia calcicola TaxID=1690605 RepID=A0ACC3MRK7_9PEZI|nr:pre-mRNA processing RNA-helicase [Vermiconidia calcicola]
MARSPARREPDYAGRERQHERGHARRRSRSRDRDVRIYRSRSPHGHDLMKNQRRYDDRETYRRRDRSRDRYTGSHRERSRDRKRSRETSPVRERRDRDRRRDGRDHYDDRDRKRPKRDEESQRNDSRDRKDGKVAPKDGESSRPSTADADEEAKKAKLAKVEAWKKKVAEQKRQEAALNGSASPQVKTEKANAASPTPDVGSPATLSHPATAPASPATPPDGAKSASPTPYAGKFDPRAIAKRAAAAIERQKAALGGDVVIPKSANQNSNMNGANLADNSKVASGSRGNGGTKPAKIDAKITGFGLNKTATEKPEKQGASKGAAPLEEEEIVKRKLEKLPDMPTTNDSGDAALANDSDGQDEGEAIRSDEEEAEQVRKAAQRRAEAEAQAVQQDVTMADTESTATLSADTGSTTTAKAETEIKVEESTADKMDEDEDVDPLDAFMSNLEQPHDNNRPNLAIGKGKKNEPQVFNSDDEADLDAVGNGTDDILAIAAKRKKKEIPTVNHGKIDYEPFRKNFYAESVELSDMTLEDVEAVRADLDNIKCRGVDVPKPIMKWSQGGFGTQILDVIRDQKFEKPTSIQAQALPAIMSGRDVIGVAKTGSGKTVAFILPMFRHIKDQRPLENLDGPIGLILAPTRELATQIHRECKPYLKALNLRAVCAYGGAPIKDQIAELKRGAEIVVCTPGRMIDLLAANTGRVTNLRRVTYVVLDEADRMFDMGFEPQITKMLNNIRPQRQTVLFSATFPRGMEALARKALTKPIEIIVGGRSVVASEITQVIEVRSEASKFKRLLELLGELHEHDEDARSLIFVERQETADNMLKDLLRKQYPCVSIHGGREQIDRDQAINDFKAGVYPVMVATSVAARGLDVKQLKLVVNYDAPNHIEDYVHRSGRTGRAGNTGTAVTFVTPEQDRFAPFLVKALTDSHQDVPEALQKLREEHDENVKAGQAKKIGSGFGGRGIERLDAARDAERAREKKQYKTGDEPEEEEEQGEKKTDKKETEVDKLVAKATGGVKDRDTQPAADASLIPANLNNALANAMKVQKAEKPEAKANDPLAKVSAVAATIGSRLGRSGSTRPGVPIDNRGPDAGAFHATLEINDFPQKARWGVTNRTNVAKILEATGTSITSKGIYYAAGKEPQAGELPKLYILVEGDTEVQVENAMGELTRLLKDGTIAAYAAENRAPAGGRYSVV